MRLRQAIELQPDFSQPHETLALVELETGHTSDALKEARTGLALAPSAPRTIGEAGYVLAAAGQSKEARELLESSENTVPKGSAFPTFAALIYMGLGHRKEALDVLEAMSDPKTGAGIYGLHQRHILDELRTDPRYQKLVAKARKIRTSRPSP